GKIVVRNAGAQVWELEGENAVRLGYRWLNFAGDPVKAPTYPGHIGIPHEVAPRESVAFDEVVIHTPTRPGDYALQFDLRRGGEWFSNGASTPAETQVRIKAPPLEWGAEFLTHNKPAHLVVGTA